jgi:hypothetical protein
MLLARNTPLYLQLLAAYNLGNAFGFEDENRGRQFSAKVSAFVADAGLFQPGADLKYYIRLISMLHSTLRLTSSRARAVLAYIILFHFSQVKTWTPLERDGYSQNTK